MNMPKKMIHKESHPAKPRSVSKPDEYTMHIPITFQFKTAQDGANVILSTRISEFISRDAATAIVYPYAIALCSEAHEQGYQMGEPTKGDPGQMHVHFDIQGERLKQIALQDLKKMAADLNPSPETAR